MFTQLFPSFTHLSIYDLNLTKAQKHIALTVLCLLQQKSQSMHSSKQEEILFA